MTRPVDTGTCAEVMGSSRLGEGPGRDAQEPANALQGTCNGRQDAATRTAPVAQEPELTGVVREQADPEPQKSRSWSNCKCGKPCFYCGEAIDGRHQHDHMPIPWRHGGRETVPACNLCHSLKDRRRALHAWPPASQRAAAAGMSWSALLLSSMLLDITRDPFSEPYDLNLERDQALALIQRCTTCEARIYAARLVCLVLDEAQRLDSVVNSPDAQQAA